ncbi:hypothetical protein MKP08_04865 [Erythrobacter sp. LQ02-29]|uniref:hypothetical protein n=1 Tax=Erythrobacter sp. LQ02-29 TaxID=2920384 RepID=UPI001F4E3797|nr:hypothetical protein [Erythrobacter sp. LQ02-29]MCP9222077.1 hypothetical protein [Erythrobacter sp. LQ02-29]
MGRNDTSSGGLSPEQTYQAILSYWNANAVGVLARGWRPYQMANIACDAGETTIDLHDRIIGSFSADVAGGSVIDLQRIRDSGGGYGEGFAPFALGAQNATYFQTVGGVLDTTHPSIYGTKIMASGGDTPQYGYAALA